MNARPPAWEVQLSGGTTGAPSGGAATENASAHDGASVVITPRVELVGHQAAERLLRGRYVDGTARKALAVTWKVGARLDGHVAEREFPIKASHAQPSNYKGRVTTHHVTAIANRYTAGTHPLLSGLPWTPLSPSLDSPLPSLEQSSKDEPPGAQPPTAVWAKDLKLYPRQLKVLRWMQEIEAVRLCSPSMAFDRLR